MDTAVIGALLIRLESEQAEKFGDGGGGGRNTR
jgi:hypothetical protein